MQHTISNLTHFLHIFKLHLQTLWPLSHPCSVPLISRRWCLALLQDLPPGSCTRFSWEKHPAVGSFHELVHNNLRHIWKKSTKDTHKGTKISCHPIKRQAMYRLFSAILQSLRGHIDRWRVQNEIGYCLNAAQMKYSHTFYYPMTTLASVDFRSFPFTCRPHKILDIWICPIAFTSCKSENHWCTHANILCLKQWSWHNFNDVSMQKLWNLSCLFWIILQSNRYALIALKVRVQISNCWVRKSAICLST